MFKAHRLLCHSALGLSVTKKRKNKNQKVRARGSISGETACSACSWRGMPGSGPGKSYQREERGGVKQRKGGGDTDREGR